MGGKLANGPHSENGEWVLLRLAACHKWHPQGLITGPILFNPFINHLDSGTESTITKFANSIKLDGKGDTSERRDILKRWVGWKNGQEQPEV